MADMIKNIEHVIGHTFKDQNLLMSALTHSSTGETFSYERLEFLGDRVLGLSMAQILYDRFPQEPEGDLAKRLAALAQGSLLAIIAKEIDLGQYIRLSDSERDGGGAENDNILADVMEAILGALYLDSGFEACFNMINRLWAGHFDKMKAPPQHPKTALQEWTQSRNLGLPVYTVVNQDGPDHAPMFTVRASIDGYPPADARGKSRQVAEKQAAAALYITVKDKL